MKRKALLRDIRRLLKQDIAIEAIAGFEPLRPLRLDDSARARPSNGRPQQRHARRPHVGGNGTDANSGRNKKPQRPGGNQRYSRPA